MKKIKNIVIKFLKENYKGIILLLVIYILCNFKLNVSIYSPGGIINLNDRIKSEDKIYNSKGSFNMSYVTMIKGTIPSYLMAKVLPTWDIVKNEEITYEDENIDETIKIDKYYFLESISNAYQVAYNYASIPYTIKRSNNYIAYISEESKTNLKKFDNILKYDNIEFTSFIKMQKYIESKKEGEKVTFEVLRNDKHINCYAKIIKIEETSKIGISTIVINEYNSDINITIEKSSNESGSSGGFMTSLAIYNAITKEDITKGYKIAGTGTIDEEGNVGIIGGVPYKLSGAVKNKADIFLVPSDNYKEALKYKRKHKLDIKLISIKTFEEAIDYLKSMEVLKK